MAIDPEADPAPPYLNVRQLAHYLQVNEKKVYALVADGVIPGTKATGKWLFPRELVDRWLLETSHGGALSDRLIVSGGEDALLARATTACATELQAHAMICYAPLDTRIGLALLDRGRSDAAVLHWGPADESGRRHPALLQHYHHHREWVLVHLFRREQGLVCRPGLGEAPAATLLRGDHRWVLRAQSSGTQRFLQETIAAAGVRAEDLQVVAHAGSEREVATLLRLGRADVAPGTRALATEFGLAFTGSGWEDVDLVVSRGNYFRDLLQRLLRWLLEPAGASTAQDLGGYDLSRSGRLIS